MRVACSKRTSAMDRHLAGRGDVLDGGADLAPRPRLRPGARAEVVEREQRRADDRGRGAHPELDRLAELAQPGLDRGDEATAWVLEHAAAEQHLDRAAVELEPPQRRADEREHLAGEA